MKISANLAEFKAEFECMMPAYNLGDYDVTFAEKALKGADAQLVANASSRIAKVTLSTTCPKERLKLVARHEAAHLFLRGYATLAASRHTMEKQLDDEEERLCTVLEKWEIR